MVVTVSHLQRKYRGIANGNGMIVQSTMEGLLLFKQKVECGGDLYCEKMGRLRCDFVVLKGRRKKSNSSGVEVFRLKDVVKA